MNVQLGAVRGDQVLERALVAAHGGFEGPWVEGGVEAHWDLDPAEGANPSVGVVVCDELRIEV